MKASALQKINDFEELEISNDEFEKITEKLSTGIDARTEEDKEASRLIKEMILEADKMADTNPKNFYLVWSQMVMRNAEFESLSSTSKIYQFLARAIFGSFQKQVIAPFAYWTEPDKIRCLPMAFDPKVAGNELVKRNKYITTRQIQELRNQFVENCLSFANSVSVVVSVSIFMTMYFLSMNGWNKAAVLTAIAGGVAYKFRNWIREKTKQEKSYLLHRVLFAAAASTFIGHAGYVKYQEHALKVKQEQAVAQAVQDSLTNAVNSFNSANDAWLKEAEANHQYAAQTFLNVIVNARLEQFVQVMKSNKENVGNDFYKSRVQDVQDTLIKKDLPVFNKLLGENIINQSDVAKIQAAVEEKMKQL